MASALASPGSGSEPLDWATAAFPCDSTLGRRASSPPGTVLLSPGCATRQRRCLSAASREGSCLERQTEPPVADEAREPVKIVRIRPLRQGKAGVSGGGPGAPVGRPERSSRWRAPRCLLAHRSRGAGHVRKFPSRRLRNRLAAAETRHCVTSAALPMPASPRMTEGALTSARAARRGCPSELASSGRTRYDGVTGDPARGGRGLRGEHELTRTTRRRA